MADDSWGDTRSQDGVHRRICMTKIPTCLRIRDIFNYYGIDSLEGVCFNRPKKLCFVQFKRPYDHTEALKRDKIDFKGRTIGIRPFRPSSPPTKRTSAVSNTLSRYARQHPRDEPVHRDEQPSNGWGTPIYDNGNYNYGSLRHDEHLSNNRNRGNSPTRMVRYLDKSVVQSAEGRFSDDHSKRQRSEFEQEKRRTPPLATSDRELWTNEWKTTTAMPTTATDSQSRNHLKLVNYGPPNSTHSFGQTTIKPQSSLPSNASQHQPIGGSLPKFDEQKLIHSKSDISGIGISSLSNHGIATVPQLNNNSSTVVDDSNLETLTEPIEFSLRFILSQRSARSLSVKQIDLIQEYLEKEKQAVRKIEIASIQSSFKEQAQKADEPNPSQNKGQADGKTTALDPEAQKLREQLRALQSM